MNMNLEKIVEEVIKQAQERGEFDNLKGRENRLICRRISKRRRMCVWHIRS